MNQLRAIEAKEFLAARALLERRDYGELDILSKPIEATFDASLCHELVAYAIDRFPDDINALDAWMAPRVHYCIRVSRRTAADVGLWFWLAATVFRPYVEHRFGSRKIDGPWWRYDGIDLRNGVSRLWWAAELLRDGRSYELVPAAFRTVRTFMFISELRYSWHKEAARAFTKTAVLSGEPLSDEAIQEMSKRLNAYLVLDSLESHGGNTSIGSSDFDPHWALEQPTFTDLRQDVEKLVGPSAGFVDKSREKLLTDWLQTIRLEVAQKGV